MNAEESKRERDRWLGRSSVGRDDIIKKACLCTRCEASEVMSSWREISGSGPFQLSLRAPGGLSSDSESDEITSIHALRLPSRSHTQVSTMLKQGVARS